MTFLTALKWGITSLYAVAMLLLLLEIPYIIHFSRPEDGAQRWYHLADKIDSW
jgi:hypothetical protein